MANPSPDIASNRSDMLLTRQPIMISLLDENTVNSLGNYDEYLLNKAKKPDNNS
jgi:hypothetical protein